MQHHAPLFVEVAVEDIDRLVEHVRHDRPAVALLQVGVRVLYRPPAVLVHAEEPLVPEHLHVRREAFVQPTVRPVATGEEVPEPHMRQFVRDQGVARVIPGRLFVEEDGLGHRRRARVLHPAEDEIADDDLAVLRPGVGHPGDLLEHANHFRRVLKRQLAARHILRLDEVVHVQSVVARLNPAELARRERHDVRRVGPVLVPVEGLRAVPVLLLLEQPPVREREPCPRDCREHLRRLLLARMVEARDPVARIFVLALRPHLHRLVGVRLVRRDEVQPDPRRRGVLDGDRDLLPFLPLAKVHEELRPVVPVVGRLFRHQDRLNFHVNRVELCRRQAAVHGSHGVGHRAAHPLVRDIQADIHLHMQHIDNTVPRPHRVIARKRVGWSLLLHPVAVSRASGQTSPPGWSREAAS